MNRKTFIKTVGVTSSLIGMGNLNFLEKLSESFSISERMPVLFLGHGSPMNAIEENEFVKGFRTIAKSIPKPKSILCVSAHWFTKGTKVTAMKIPKTIHDFGGFPQELFQVQYPAPGNPELARETAQLLQPTHVELDEKWGLDHGAWSVIKHLYPNADIPVIQLSIDYSKPASFHFDLAKQLDGLRNKGILIIGSGNIVHNLGMIDWKNMNKVDYGYDWAIEVRAKINQYILDGNYKPLIEYQKQGKAFDLAIPSPDHYLPLIYALGLKSEKDNLSFFNDQLLAGSLSMTSLKMG